MPNVLYNQWSRVNAFRSIETSREVNSLAVSVRSIKPILAIMSLWPIIEATLFHRGLILFLSLQLDLKETTLIAIVCLRERRSDVVNTSMVLLDRYVDVLRRGPWNHGGIMVQMARGEWLICFPDPTMS